MDFSDHHSPFMGALRPFAAHTDAIAVHPQFPMNNEQFNPHSHLEETRAFKRARISETNQFNAIPRPPMNPMKPQPNLPPMNPMKPQPNVPVNKGTSHLFFKTRMCAKFKTGMCRNGENCNFAHGVEDLRKPPPNWQELVGVRDENRSSGNWDDDQKIIQKMKLCKKYCNGQECPYGERCNFLHEDPAKFRDDSGRFREASTTSIGSTIGSPKSRLNNSNNLDNNNRPLNNTGFDVLRTNPNPNPNPKSTYWKTKLCIKWEITGQCPFGDKCHFAHGQAELQLPAGRIEAEATGFTSLPTTVISESDAATDVSPTIAATGVPPAPNLEEQGKKCLLKWKRSKKINQIYGDWLDDMPLVSNLPRIVKS